MSLDTIISSALVKPDHTTCGLVLMGGGARTAYQVGVLRQVALLLTRLGHRPTDFPFQVLAGTSAGAINAAYLASAATQGLQAFEQLADFWWQLRSPAVYEFTLPPWATWAGRASRWLAAWRLSRSAKMRGALLDNTPLVDTLHRAISLQGIEDALQARAIQALAVTASSYSSGVHWTFCHSLKDDAANGWDRPGKRAESQPITIEHLMASSAIPFIFPATPLWVDGACEQFGDGSMRNISPLSPAIHLGARKLLVVGVAQPQRAGLSPGTPGAGLRHPTMGGIAGHAMASVFHDTLQADVEQAQRVTRTLMQLPREVAAHLPYSPVQVLCIQPSQSLDMLAQRHLHELPAATRHALEVFGKLQGGGAALASYLLFEPGFVHALAALGAQDVLAREAELMAFFAPPETEPTVAQTPPALDFAVP
ncbi:MAG: patatin-like phospholipase family protein [Burkholderiales bacterium]